MLPAFFANSCHERIERQTDALRESGPAVKR
jgi:hypothetical protein